MKHCITISFETDEDVDSSVIEAIAEDMKVQLEGLDDYRREGGAIPYRSVVMKVERSSSLSGPRMGDALREEVCEFIIDSLKDVMFGDGLERDYIEGGISYPGVVNMTDQELYEELCNCTQDEDHDLVIRVRIDLEIDEALTEE